MTHLLKAILAATMGLALAGGAFAQTPPPVNQVMAHFRAYRAALEGGDIAAAEREATAALDASIARDGDGGNTGVLAINLAQARLSLGRRDDAYDPALRAFNIASAGSANLDPLLTRIVLGRAELTEARWRDSRLPSALEEARARPELNAETYLGATDLGRWLFAQEAYERALPAWEIAMQIADASGEENHFARAESRMGHAAALFTDAMASTIDAQARPTDTRLGGGASAAFDEADSELLEAQNLMGPYAYTPGDGGLTVGQRFYASAMAWRTLLRAFTETRGIRRPTPRGAEFQVPSQGDPRPFCHVESILDPRPNFPPGASSAFAVGAVVVRFTVDEAGHVTDSQVAAAIPERWFREAIERVASQWRLERQSDSPANCRYSPVEFESIRFYFRN